MLLSSGIVPPPAPDEPPAAVTIGADISLGNTEDTVSNTNFILDGIKAYIQGPDNSHFSSKIICQRYPIKSLAKE